MTDASTSEPAKATAAKAAAAKAAPAKAESTKDEAPAFLAIELTGIVQEYPGPEGKPPHRVLEKVDLSFDRPGINMLLGPSGCGKSTVLRMMGGVRPIGVTTPTKGTVKIGGVPSIDAHEDAVMVFQRYANRPDLSVWDNVALPFQFKLWKRKVSRAEWTKRVDEILVSVGLADKKDLRPSQLSGGQNQRVALARALVLRPKILLMDEPFGALDAQTREEMQQLLATLLEQQPCLVVFVTHDVSEAIILGDRVIVMSGSPATVVDDFTVDEPRPRTDAWLMSSSIVQMKDRILARLHESKSHGQVRVSF